MIELKNYVYPIKWIGEDKKKIVAVPYKDWDSIHNCLLELNSLQKENEELRGRLIEITKAAEISISNPCASTEYELDIQIELSEELLTKTK